MKENPYRLARDIRGIGFKTADQLAQRLGIPKESMLRARAGISYALMEAVADGHCALPEENLLTLAEELLEIGRGTLAEALALEAAEGGVVIDHIGDTTCGSCSTFARPRMWWPRSSGAASWNSAMAAD